MRLIVVALPAVLIGCSKPSPDAVAAPATSYGTEIAVEETLNSSASAEPDPEVVRERQIEATRQKDPALNWVNIGITTGKFSESLGSSVHQTYDECINRSAMEDNECFPIPALPKSYWDAKPAAPDPSPTP